MSEHPDDRTPLRSEFAADPEMADLVRDFVGELPEKVRKLTDAAAQGRADETRRLAHQLKGSAGGYGFAPIGHVAAAIENALHAADHAARQQTLKSLTVQIQELNSLCNRAVAGLAPRKAAGR